MHLANARVVQLFVPVEGFQRGATFQAGAHVVHRTPASERRLAESTGPGGNQLALMEAASIAVAGDLANRGRLRAPTRRHRLSAGGALPWVRRHSAVVPIPTMHCAIGALMVLLSLPLILGKVPMNRVYGVRCHKAFVSERNWYELNAYGGKLLLACGLFLLAFALFTRDVAPPPASPRATMFMVVPLLALLPVLVLIGVRARRMPDG